MANVWSTGRLRAVYHPLGTHTTGQKRLRRANFDFLVWDSDADGVPEHYVSVPSAVLPTSVDIGEAGNPYDIGTMFGFYEPGYEIIDASNPGEIDTWPGLHSFGYY